MSSFQEYEQYDAIGLADLIRRRQVSSMEVLEAAIERIDHHNVQLNAVVDTFYDSARQRAAQTCEGAFGGVPFLLKDLGIQVAGQRVTNGSRFWRDQICVKDSTLILRYRAAGLVLTGMTSTAEHGLSCETAPDLFGPTRNPWDLTRSAGGSSGGAAAAVASGMVPAAHASDGGGSIRIPSSCCGLFGLKTSRGRNPLGPDVGEGWNGLSVQHVITRSVRDSAAFLDVTHGPEAGDPYAAPAFGGRFLDGLGLPIKPLRIAFQTVTHEGEPANPVVAEAVRDTATLLTSLGHQVEEARPQFDAAALKHAMFIIVGCNAANAVQLRSRVLGRAATPDDLEPITWRWIQRCESFSGRDMAWAVGIIHAVGRQLGRFFEGHDILLTPTNATPPLPLGTIDMRSEDLDAYYDQIHGNNTFTTVYNCTGVPAANVPLVWADGLPIGVQLAAPLGHEMRLLRLSAQLEEARPWGDRRPRAG